MKKFICLLFLIPILTGCAGPYSSVREVRDLPNLKNVVVNIPSEMAFRNLLTVVNECAAFFYDTRVHQVMQRDGSNEIAVLAPRKLGGTAIYYAAFIKPVDASTSQIFLYWHDQARWRVVAERSANWSLGQGDCDL